MAVTIIAEVGFYHNVPPTFNANDRWSLKGLFATKIRQIDTNGVIHQGENLPLWSHVDGHLTDADVEAHLRPEVAKMNHDSTRYDLVYLNPPPALAQLCYVIRSGQIICYHCYGLEQTVTDQNQVTRTVIQVAMNNKSYPLQVTYAYPAPLT